jgi:YVTN family beta-propeller protein
VQGDDVTLQIEAARVKVGDAPYAMSQDAKRGLLFVTKQQDGSVSVLALASAKEIKRIPVGDYPEGIDYSSVLGRCYVASWFDNALLVINPDKLAVEAQIPCGDGGRAFGDFIRE